MLLAWIICWTSSRAPVIWDARTHIKCDAIDLTVCVVRSHNLGFFCNIIQIMRKDVSWDDIVMSQVIKVSWMWLWLNYDTQVFPGYKPLNRLSTGFSMTQVSLNIPKLLVGHILLLQQYVFKNYIYLLDLLPSLTTFICQSASILLPWIYFNPSMDKWSHVQ